MAPIGQTIRWMAGYSRSAKSHLGLAMNARPPRLPGYLLGPRLGGGPTCDVYSAVDTGRGRKWAVKVLRAEAASDLANVQLFRREARVGLAVRHPHLVRVVRARVRNVQPFFAVMARVRGRSLRSVIRNRKWLAAALVGSIARQTAGAAPPCWGRIRSRRRQAG